MRWATIIDEQTRQPAKIGKVHEVIDRPVGWEPGREFNSLMTWVPIPDKVTVQPGDRYDGRSFAPAPNVPPALPPKPDLVRMKIAEARREAIKRATAAHPELSDVLDGGAEVLLLLLPALDEQKLDPSVWRLTSLLRYVTTELPTALRARSVEELLTLDLTADEPLGEDGPAWPGVRDPRGRP